MHLRKAAHLFIDSIRGTHRYWDFAAYKGELSSRDVLQQPLLSSSLTVLVMSFASFSLLALSLLSLGWHGHAVPNNDNMKRQSGPAPLLTIFPGQDVLPTLADIINLNATNGTYLPIQNIQGDILVGMKKTSEIFYFFHINDADDFKLAMQSYIPNITSTAVLLDDPSNQPLAFVNVAFSQTGLDTLGVTDDLGDAQFTGGQFADAPNLGDDVSLWEAPFAGTNIHGVFLIGSSASEFTTQYSADITTIFGSSISQVYEIDAAARPGAEAGHERKWSSLLGSMRDPAVTGFATSVLPGQTIIAPGTILCNRPGDTAVRPIWALDGTFMAFRKLKQLVPEFNQWTLENSVEDTNNNLTQQEGAESPIQLQSGQATPWLVLLTSKRAQVYLATPQSNLSSELKARLSVTNDPVNCGILASD
ncbi:hypothetical protein NM688_g3414 [Phlebia brevispora]|uniref:Uncharacterized protein n=1 Tax=Phlebia brevispora TaxID=194682 RepID=A0ACC1T5W6_9APHY|nr:hypothetical protein NM688_g3414 [Phlebia brevispora]